MVNSLQIILCASLSRDVSGFFGLFCDEQQMNRPNHCLYKPVAENELSGIFCWNTLHFFLENERKQWWINFYYEPYYRK